MIKLLGTNAERNGFLFLVLFFLSLAGYAQKKVSLESLLIELTDFSAVAKLPDPVYELKQVSSYDRHSTSKDKPGWFANEDHTNFIRQEIQEGRKEYVMMDEDGPGAIVRFWETTFKRPGTLRIYFDYEKTARLVISGYDLMKFPFPLNKGLLAPHSSYEPEAKGGSTLYLPLPYQKHCRVTWEDFSDPIQEKRYYQINFRKYKPETKIKTFSTKEFTANNQLIGLTDAKLLEPVTSTVNNTPTKLYKFDVKNSRSIDLPNGSNAVSMIQIKLNNPSDYNDAILRELYLMTEFDGDTTVYCPLSDFFGSGAGNMEVKSWYRTVIPKENMISRWIMPYQHRGKIFVMNTSGKEIDVSLSITTKPWKWTSSSLYFHADWRYEKNVEIKRGEVDKPIEWDFIKIDGNGIFVGETLSINNHMHKWYGEGDQKIWVDHEVFPSEYGTGLEDYYNTSWAPVVLYNTPFANATRADNEDSFGENTFTRTRNLDVVPFKNRLHYSVEMLGWDNGTADVAATTYWYGKKKAKSNITRNN